MTEASTINTEEHREELERVLEHYNLTPACLSFTDSFPNEPMRASKCQKLLSRIIFKSLITAEEKEAALKELHLFPEDVKELEDDRMFLKHTLLKYICSIQQRWQPAYECAKWAFYHMRRV
ncbi:MAG TPA: hypothetical protein DDW94_00840 [Deltaproteobacteria bacterium]|nr:MAG: hypothetical protein A2Z79_06205 [Deltaproteobacteria bacterium GWA2_55_82]OIJ73223.1 MAG: hypothetical protein A2V21_302455 [Deltaproteobacteria bacterium GWC2_55_46]HBG45516.1 hypothetical protein [Deltaproteobacteria bacterium]HCY10347.1 hypothetical protein [Deltaproteobacteria bacterium]